MHPINLMSARARRHHCVRMRLRLWTRVLLVAILFLAAITGERYSVYQTAAERQLALEAAYDPIEEIKSANKLLAKQIALIRNEEQFVLALSDPEPTILLLGMMGKAVADSNERVFLQRIELVNLGLAGGPPHEKKTVIDLAGFANSGAAVAQFAEAVRAFVPFGKADVLSSKESHLKTHTMQEFSLQGTF